MIKKNDDDEESTDGQIGAEGESTGGQTGAEGTGTGGQTGAIAFHYRDILSTDVRDDVLPDTEVRRLLAVHEAQHKNLVDEQKRKRKARDDIKNGRVKATRYDSLGLRIGQGGSGGGVSPYKSHPISNHAQFSGATDRKVTGVPSDNLAETNEQDKNDLLNELNLQLRHKHVPKFNPQPRPR